MSRDERIGFILKQTECIGCGTRIQYNGYTPRRSLDCNTCLNALKVAAEYGDTEQGLRLLHASEPAVVKWLARRSAFKKEQMDILRGIFEEQNGDGSWEKLGEQLREELAKRDA